MIRVERDTRGVIERLFRTIRDRGDYPGIMRMNNVSKAYHQECNRYAIQSGSIRRCVTGRSWSLQIALPRGLEVRIVLIGGGPGPGCPVLVNTSQTISFSAVTQPYVYRHVPLYRGSRRNEYMVTQTAEYGGTVSLKS